MVKLLRPFVGTAPDRQVLAWARGAFKSKAIPMLPHDVEHAVEMLADAGLIVVPKKYYLRGHDESHYNAE